MSSAVKDAKQTDPHLAMALRALESIQNGMVVGLGSGRAASAFIQALGERVQQGLRVRGIPSSLASQQLALRLGIPLTDLSEVSTIDVAVDGADEVDPQLNAIKGLGGALVREKVVASAAKRFIILVGPEKLTPKLGLPGSTRGKTGGVLPVEVVPFALAFCARALNGLGFTVQPRQTKAGLYCSDNGNLILDCHLTGIDDPQALETRLLAIPGVVGTGLFAGMVHQVLVGDGDDVTVMQATAS